MGEKDVDDMTDEELNHAIMHNAIEESPPNKERYIVRVVGDNGFEHGTLEFFICPGGIGVIENTGFEVLVISHSVKPHGKEPR